MKRAARNARRKISIIVNLNTPAVSSFQSIEVRQELLDRKFRRIDLQPEFMPDDLLPRRADDQMYA